MGENDAHPLTEEQLDALVDEIQDRLGDSTARKYGRRGVLAALGVAALGTGSASAQASGSVGTAGSPVDVEGYDVTASNSFTDPAGVTHSGELADISDVGASGQWQETNSGSNIEPIDGETVGTGTEDVDVGSVSTDVADSSEYNIVRMADQPGGLSKIGNLQTVINNLPTSNVHERNVVFCQPQATYGAVSIPSNTYVHLNGAEIRPQSNLDAVEFTGIRSALIGPGRINTSQVAGYSSSHILVNTDTIGDRLTARQGGKTVNVVGPIEISGAGGGIGLDLVSDDAANDTHTIGVGNTFGPLLVSKVDKIVRIDTRNGGWCNAGAVEVYGGDYQTAGISHENTSGAANQGSTQIKGAIQSDSNGPTMRNQTTESSVRFEGQLWDPADAPTAIDGPGIRYRGPTNIDESFVNFGIGTTIRGWGQESANADTPTIGKYRVGDFVDFTDTGDGSGTGLYQLRYDDTWRGPL